MHKLTTDELTAAIKAISPTFPQFDFENTLEGAELTLYLKLWLEIDRLEQRRLAMLERFERIMAIRQDLHVNRNASIRDEEYIFTETPGNNAADEMIMGILSDLIQ